MSLQARSFYTRNNQGRNTPQNRVRTPSSSNSQSRTPSPTFSNETPVARRREVTTLSTAEVNKIFDAFNAVSTQLKEQREVLDEMDKRQRQLITIVEDLQEEQKTLNERLNSLETTSKGDEDSKIPPEISADVHLVHNNLQEEKQYRPEESLTSKHNTSVRKLLEDEVNSQEKEYPRKFVKRAAARYYETKRRLYLASLPANVEKAAKDQQSNKLRSRRKRLYDGRVEVAVGEEKNAMAELTQEYMSDEEDGEGQLRGKWVVKRPMWRSSLAERLMARLQRKVDAAVLDSGRAKKERVDGGRPSHRGIPRNRVEWALRRQRDEEDEDSDVELQPRPRKERRVRHALESSDDE